MELRGSMTITNKGHLQIGGLTASELAHHYGTPLMVLDQQCLEDRIQLFKQSFVSSVFKTEIVYASKAFINRYICQMMTKYGLGIDAIGTGDLRLLEQSRFPMSQVYLHGNAKSQQELEMALDLDVGRIVVDSIAELKRLHTLCHLKQKKVSVLLRLNPKVETSTHPYLRTALESSKFGISISNRELPSMIADLRDDPYLQLQGIHCHIGSQINDEAVYIRTAEAMLQLVSHFKNVFNYSLKELNLGGGFAISYTDQDTPPQIAALLPAVIRYIENYVQEHQLGLEKLIIEPGRAIIGDAGTTLYEVVAQKTTDSGQIFYMVDGGMSDNPRPALYNALYEAALVDHMHNDQLQNVTIAGKCCESGDIIIEDIALPQAPDGSIIAVAVTGAYTYAMSSNYNGVPRPAIIAVKDGNAHLITRREDPAQMHHLDVASDLIL